ncbi:hypothetical protein CcarbDRAFT_1318 [Clostridium carboxidivorans P7]|uniref:Uncharacterized protein n=1 Tax=Clostridium carboxidivorans P7 TaxID=536227 RepID=C6PRA1_9CLOT|nr:hypothetical protein CcarbDRAFT_1318 [Clostridium carboxidivorans P7]
MVVKLKIKTINTRILAVLLSPLSTAKYIAVGMVCVFPGIFPAIINVAPNSPKALAKDKTKPLIIPGKAIGSVTLKNTLSSLAPNVLAAFSQTLSIFMKAALQLWYIKGRETTKEAIQAAVKVKIRLLLKTLRIILPIKPYLPNITKRPYPTTEGGNTIGKIIKTSRTSLPLNSYLVNSLAKVIPIMQVKIVEIKETFKEIIIGLSIICNNPLLFIFQFVILIIV